MSKRGAGWADMDYRYKHNKMPEQQVVTGWDEVIEACNLTEAQALEIIATDPSAKEAKQIKRKLLKDKAYNDRFYPECVLHALGLLPEVQGRADGTWSNARGTGHRQRKAQEARERRAAAKQAAQVAA